MNSMTIQRWVSKRKKLGVMQHRGLGVLAFIAGLIVLFLTFWFTYAVIYGCWMGICGVTELFWNKEWHLSHGLRLLTSGVFMMLLFVQHFRTDASYWGEYERREYVAAPVLQMQTGVLGGIGFMLAYPGTSANMVADLLLSGPRLITGAWKSIRQAGQLKRLDEHGCAELLSFLAGKRDATPYEELKNAGWEEWLDQLRLIEGVQFLNKGLLLSQELRDELEQAGTPS